MQTKIVGVDCDEGTPVPIPNTVVKLIYADNTWLVTAREDRTMPTQSDLKKTQIASIFLNSSVGRASDCYSEGPGFESPMVYHFFSGHRLNGVWKWPVGQAAKTTASHAVNGSSILPRVTNFFLDIIPQRCYNNKGFSKEEHSRC